MRELLPALTLGNFQLSFSVSSVTHWIFGLAPLEYCGIDIRVPGQSVYDRVLAHQTVLLYLFGGSFLVHSLHPGFRQSQLVVGHPRPVDVRRLCVNILVYVFLESFPLDVLTSFAHT